MKQSNPQRIEFLRQRVETLVQLLREHRFSNKEMPNRLRELDALRWAIPILERHAKESFEAQQKLERAAGHQVDESTEG